MNNREIAELFRNVAAAFSIKNEKKFYFQIVAYKNAAGTIESLTSQLEDLHKENRLQTVPGIGEIIRSRIEELLKKGSVSHFETVLKDIPKSVFALIHVPSIGPKKAYKLVKKLSLNNPETIIEDLIIKAKNHEIARVPSFGEKSEKDILRALLEFKKNKGKNLRMTLPYAEEIAEKVLTYLKRSPFVNIAISLGSLRRMMPTIGDIDIAVSTDNPKEVIKHFITYPYLERIIEKGLLTASILTSGGKQIDLMTVPVDSFGALLQHQTGSKDHNVRLREYALKKGFSLSEKGIKNLKTNKIEKFNTEEKFYEKLGMSWIPPEIRENAGEIELAIRHELPKLIELSDIKGDLHIHSSFPIEPSHDLGQTDIKTMAEYALKLKYEYIGFSEHNPSVLKHSKAQTYSLIARRNEIINQAQSSIKNIRIFKLLEIDILSSGELAIDNKSMELLDGAIVSIHSSFNKDKKDMTKRVLRGLSHPKAKIFAHPTGRLLNERSEYELDFEQIFDFCIKNNKTLEVNSWPQRLDLPDTLIKEAIQNGVKLIINTDSHAIKHINLMRYGVAMARRGWAQKNDILNTLTYNEFNEWLKN